MKKGVFLYVIAFLLLISFSYAVVPDADQDGVPDAEDRCQNSQTTLVDQFGCSCAQKNCPNDNNPCTNDCSAVNGIVTCGFVNNNNQCTCTDSDSGKEYYVKGRVVQEDIVIEDSCFRDGLRLTEYYCIEDGYSREVFECPNGCKDGACIERPTKTCAEQGGDICTEGEICPGRSLDALNTNRCCSVQCTIPSWQYCSECGNGLFNNCDKKECNSINEGCYFINQLIGGDCLSCSGSVCRIYADRETCIEDHCGLGNCNWNGNNCVTSEPINDLPSPNHQILFGYYYADGRDGDFTSEVWDYTNLYVALPEGHWTSDNKNWRNDFRNALQKAFNNNKDILLCAGCNGGLIDAGIIEEKTIEEYYDYVLDAASPYWSKVKLVEAGHEPNWDKATTEAKINILKSKMQSRGLVAKPIGITYSRRQVLSTEGIFASNLDWVAIEAYVDPPGSSVSQDNINDLNNYLNQVIARVPQDREIVLIMQAYDRNGQWTNINTLADLQEPVYIKAFNEPRVIAITMFSYGRGGGARGHTELKAHHLRIAEKVKGTITIKTCSEQNGDICADNEVCPGNTLTASDTDRCCSQQCSTYCPDCKIEGPSGTINMLSYIVAEPSKWPRTGSHEMYQIVRGNALWYIKFGDPNRFEVWRWDDNYIYHHEDRPDCLYHFLDGRWAKRFMRVGESIFVNNRIQRYEMDTCKQVEKCANGEISGDFAYTNTLLEHYPNYDAGGDIGNADVIVLEYAPGVRYEKFYFAKNWGWFKWEYLNRDTGELLASTTFNKLGGSRITPKAGCIPLP